MNEDTLNSASDISYLSVIGKTAFTLLVIIVVILVCGWLLQRVRNRGPLQHRLLKVIASTAVGNRERVVVVEVSDTWLVLGVTSGSVTRLHEMPVQETPPPVGPTAQDGSFSQRFGAAMRQQLSGKSHRE